MKFSTRPRRRPGIDISPLIDVVFQLLLFYAVTTQFVADERLKLQLPEASTAEREAGTRQEIPEVVVNAQGEILLNSQIVSKDVLEQRLKQVLTNSPGRALTIRGDRGADYGAVVQVLDAARAAGAKSINMAAVKPPPRGHS
jgi:biopolymer transport protein ExbD